MNFTKQSPGWWPLPTANNSGGARRELQNRKSWPKIIIARLAQAAPAAGGPTPGATRGEGLISPPTGSPTAPARALATGRIPYKGAGDEGSVCFRSSSCSPLSPLQS